MSGGEGSGPEEGGEKEHEVGSEAELAATDDEGWSLAAKQSRRQDTDEDGWAEEAHRARAGKRRRPEQVAARPQSAANAQAQADARPEAPAEPQVDAQTSEADANAQTADANAQTADVNAQTADANAQTADVNAQTADANAQTIDAPTSQVAAAAQASGPQLEPYALPEERDLRAAVGVDSARGSGSSAGRRGRRGIAALAGGIAALLGVAALIVIGYFNSDHYVLACGAEQVTAERGRAFPPWGTERLAGPAWQPIPIEPSSNCETREMTSRAELESAFAKTLFARIDRLLSGDGVKDIALAETLITQGLLISRTPARNEMRSQLQRMRGDILYWQAADEARAAAERLRAAAEQFGAAAGFNPRHVRDAQAWANFLAELDTRLTRGPRGSNAPALTPDASAPITAPSGLDLTRDEGSVDAEPGIALPPEEALPAAPDSQPIDAGVPRGGVLL